MSVGYMCFDSLLCLYLDYSKGFGGKFGVQTDRQDKSAVGWSHHEKVDKHESQKGIGIVSSHIARNHRHILQNQEGNTERYRHCVVTHS
jgi:hypothetical protein